MEKAKRFLVVSFVLLAVLACNLPARVPIPTANHTDTDMGTLTQTDESTEQQPAAESPTATEEPPFACSAHMTPGSAFGIEFCFPTAIASGFTHTLLSEKLPSLDAAPWDFNPDTIEIVLIDYPVDNLYHEPSLLIYPIEDYMTLGENIETMVTNLETLLIDQPPNPDTIPFLPIYNASQMMQANVRYLDFRNGNGVRFMTQYGQAAAPISNDSAIYSFMGLTDNGQYFISASFPINHELFYPDVLTEPAEGWEIFSENFMGYINNMESELAMQPSESFTPDIGLLDEMIASIFIPPDAIP
jgi:hypothetical protein